MAIYLFYHDYDNRPTWQLFHSLFQHSVQRCQGDGGSEPDAVVRVFHDQQFRHVREGHQDRVQLPLQLRLYACNTGQSRHIVSHNTLPVTTSLVTTHRQ